MVQYVYHVPHHGINLLFENGLKSNGTLCFESMTTYLSTTKPQNSMSPLSCLISKIGTFFPIVAINGWNL